MAKSDSKSKGKGGGARKYGRNRKPSEWRNKVKAREAIARARGNTFPKYPC